MFKNITGNVATLKSGDKVELHRIEMSVVHVEKVAPHHRKLSLIDAKGRNITATLHEKDNVVIL